MFIDTLIKNVKEKNNHSVIGLDPRIEYVPSFLKEKAYKEYGITLEGAAAAIFEFNKRLIDALYDIIPAVKPQTAYYEMYGFPGIKTLHDTIEYAKSKGLIVIADGKRNDIGSTAEAYSSAFLGETILDQNTSVPAFGADALTVNPFLGFDGIKPFIKDCKAYEKGIFVLIKTSNKTSGQIQDLLIHDGKSLYEKIAEYVQDWGKDMIGEYGFSNVGAVVGATYPNQAKVIRIILKNAYILVPGYGAQGGTARDVIHSFRNDGLGALINASRSVMCAYQSETWKNEYSEENFDSASRAEAIRMRDDINETMKTVFRYKDK